MNEKEWKTFQEKVKHEDKKNIGVGIYTKVIIIKKIEKVLKIDN